MNIRNKFAVGLLAFGAIVAIAGAQAQEGIEEISTLAAPDKKRLDKPISAPAATANAAETIFGARADQTRLRIVATAESWTRIRDEAGNVLFMRNLMPGQSYQVPDRKDLLLDTGNSEGLQLLLDGKPGPSLLVPGQSVVRRGISLDIDALGQSRPNVAPVRLAAVKPADPVPQAAATSLSDAVEPAELPLPAASIKPEPPKQPAPKPTAAKLDKIVDDEAAKPAAMKTAAAFEPSPKSKAEAEPNGTELAQAILKSPLNPGVLPSAPLPAQPLSDVRAAQANTGAPRPVVAPAPAGAQRVAALSPQPAQPQTIGSGTLLPPASSDVIAIEVGKGTVVRLRERAETIFIAESDVADVQVKSPGIIYIYGKRPGETVLYAVDQRDRILVSTKVVVTHNLANLRGAVEKLVPEGTVDVDSVDGSIVLTGAVASASQAEAIRKLASRFAPEQGAVINQLKVMAPNQVHLRVRIAELSRTTLKELGFNTEALFTFGTFALGIATGNPVIAAGAFLVRNPSALGQGTTNSIVASYSGKNFDINAVVDALAQEGIITMLAEPNLTALSGETASFLAGGEFPVPVAQDNNTITIEFKKFGVSLAFTPTLLDPGRINLKVRPEVSELTGVGAVQINNLQIPAVSTRQAETTVELGSGQSFAIAGLLQNNTRHDASKTPVLGEVPVLGPLFKSDRYRRNETELVIIVTPYVVRPVTANQIAAPTDGLVAPNDIERIVGGQSFRPQVPRGPEAPRGREGQGLVGPAGFILE